MPRLGTSGSRNRHRKAATEREKFLFVLKVVAFVVVTGVVGGVLLLSGGGGEGKVAVTDPAVPTITASGAAEPEQRREPREPPPAIVAPAVGTRTAVITPTAESRAKPNKPKQRPRIIVPRPDPGPPFARVGQRCSWDGALSFTKRYEPLVCRDGRWDRLGLTR